MTSPLSEKRPTICDGNKKHTVPSTAISAALVVCLSQNLGHGDRVRVRRFYRVSVCVEAALTPCEKQNKNGSMRSDIL